MSETGKHSKDFNNLCFYSKNCWHVQLQNDHFPPTENSTSTSLWAKFELQMKHCSLDKENMKTSHSQNK